MKLNKSIEQSEKRYTASSYSRRMNMIFDEENGVISKSKIARGKKVKMTKKKKGLDAKDKRISTAIVRKSA